MIKKNISLSVFISRLDGTLSHFQWWKVRHAEKRLNRVAFFYSYPVRKNFRPIHSKSGIFLAFCKNYNNIFALNPRVSPQCSSLLLVIYYTNSLKLLIEVQRWKPRWEEMILWKIVSKRLASRTFQENLKNLHKQEIGRSIIAHAIYFLPW